MSFETEILVRFAHTDPAGIVFYPRYFEMLNQVVEDWFATALDFDFRAIHLERREAVPAVHVDVDFQHPSRLGDRLRFTLAVERIGRSSLTLRIAARCGEEERLSATLVIAYVAGEPKAAQAWPDWLRADGAVFG